MERNRSCYLPYHAKHDIFLQQDGFLDKELTEYSFPKIMSNQPALVMGQNLRSPYIKQADAVRLLLFEDDFSKDQLQKNFDFYEPFTVHESSLSPSIHAVLAAKLGRVDQAYNFYLRTSRILMTITQRSKKGFI